VWWLNGFFSVFQLLTPYLSQSPANQSKGRADRWRRWSFGFYQGSVASFKLGERRAPYRNVMFYREA